MTSILVVDDEFDIAEVLRLILEDHGYEVTVASDGAEAKALLEKDETKPAMVITDRMMPLMSGPELLAWMRTQRRFDAIPVVMMSAVAPVDAPDGAAAFLQKPFTVTRLLGAVDECLKRA